MSANRDRRVLVWAGAMLISNATVSAGMAQAMPPSGRAAGSEWVRKIRFRVSFRNPLAQRLVDQKFWCYLPFDSEMQVLRSASVSMDHHIKSDHLGHHVLLLSFEEIPNHAQRIVDIEVAVLFGVTRPPEVSSQRAQWLRSEVWIETDSGPIISLARRLRRDSDDQTIAAIFEWVAQNVEYAGFIPEDLGALYALENRRGDCTEYAYLVVALARANDIPARVIGGYFADRDIAPRPNDYHNWAEVFVNGRWGIVDAQKGHILPALGRYVGFRIHHHGPVNDVGAAHRYRVEGQLQVGF
jgi:hypothetical protein